MTHIYDDYYKKKLCSYILLNDIQGFKNYFPTIPKDSNPFLVSFGTIDSIDFDREELIPLEEIEINLLLSQILRLPNIPTSLIQDCVEHILQLPDFSYNLFIHDFLLYSSNRDVYALYYHMNDSQQTRFTQLLIPALGFLSLDTPSYFKATITDDIFYPFSINYNPHSSEHQLLSEKIEKPQSALRAIKDIPSVQSYLRAENLNSILESNTDNNVIQIYSNEDVINQKSILSQKIKSINDDLLRLNIEEVAIYFLLNKEDRQLFSLLTQYSDYINPVDNLTLLIHQKQRTQQPSLATLLTLTANETLPLSKQFIFEQTFHSYSLPTQSNKHILTKSLLKPETLDGIDLFIYTLIDKKKFADLSQFIATGLSSKSKRFPFLLDKIFKICLSNSIEDIKPVMKILQPYSKFINHNTVGYNFITEDLLYYNKDTVLAFDYLFTESNISSSLRNLQPTMYNNRKNINTKNMQELLDFYLSKCTEQENINILNSLYENTSQQINIKNQLKFK